MQKAAALSEDQLCWYTRCQQAGSRWKSYAIFVEQQGNCSVEQESLLAAIYQVMVAWDALQSENLAAHGSANFTEEQRRLLDRCKAAGYGWKVFAEEIELLGRCSPSREKNLIAKVERLDNLAFSHQEPAKSRDSTFTERQRELIDDCKALCHTWISITQAIARTGRCTRKQNDMLAAINQLLDQTQDSPAAALLAENYKFFTERQQELIQQCKTTPQACSEFVQAVLETIERQRWCSAKQEKVLANAVQYHERAMAEQLAMAAPPKPRRKRLGERLVRKSVRQRVRDTI